MTVPHSPSTRLLRSSASRARTAFLYGGLVFLAYFGQRFLRRDALKYLEWAPEVYQRFWPQRGLLAVHVLTAALAMIAAPLQFVPVIRKRWPRFHRSLGWTYVVCCLISAPIAFQLAGYSSCRMCIPPFALWSIVWFAATAAAIVMAVRRNFDAHRQFMVRSWILMNGFVMVRLDTHLEYPLPMGPGVDRASMVLWVSWVVPLVLTEMWLSWSPTAAGRKRQRGAASVQGPGPA